MLSLFRLALSKITLENPHIISMWIGSKKILRKKAVHGICLHHTLSEAALVLYIITQNVGFVNAVI